MGIGITAVRQEMYPWPLVISLQCDGTHEAEDRPTYTWQGQNYVEVMHDAVAMGWLERQDGRRSRIFLCPTCSGKKVMNAPVRAGQIPPWSYTHLSTFINCPWQYFNRYIAKTTVYKPDAKQEWGNKVHAAFDKRISAGVPLPADMAKWEHWATPFVGRPVRTEYQMGIRLNGTVCGFFDADVWGRVKIDVLVEPGDQTARIFDWKTGKLREDPFELRIQALFTQAQNPGLREMAAWYVWLGEGASGQLGGQHNVSDVERTWAEVTSIVNTMNNTLASNHWVKKPSGLCSYCDVKTCEHNRNKNI